MEQLEGPAEFLFEQHAGFPAQQRFCAVNHARDSYLNPGTFCADPACRAAVMKNVFPRFAQAMPGCNNRAGQPTAAGYKQGLPEGWNNPMMCSVTPQI